MKNVTWRTLLIMSLAVQAGRVRADAGAPKLVVRRVTPSATDRRIDQFSGNGWVHCVYYNPAAAPKHQLVVFLPGTFGKGPEPRLFCTFAANEGFHVVSLAYPSTIAMAIYRDSDDPDAFLKARMNVIYGKAPFKNLRVNEPNSIRNRLVMLVRYLAARYPGEHWGQYLAKGGGLRWEKLVLAGQSQGGGHAGLLGMQHKVARVLMFGAPKDFNTHFNQPAKWYSGKCATPRDRFFSFVHSADRKGCTYPHQLENYRALQLLPRYKVIDVDRTSPPYRHSRLLTSTRPEDNPHTAVLHNKVHARVWKYLLEEPVQ